MSNLTPQATIDRMALEPQAQALLAKGWTTYFNAYNFEKWVSPDKTVTLYLHQAIACQALADYYNIEFAVL